MNFVLTLTVKLLPFNFWFIVNILIHTQQENNQAVFQELNLLPWFSKITFQLLKFVVDIRILLNLQFLFFPFVINYFCFDFWFCQLWLDWRALDISVCWASSMFKTSVRLVYWVLSTARLGVSKIWSDSVILGGCQQKSSQEIWRESENFVNFEEYWKLYCVSPHI